MAKQLCHPKRDVLVPVPSVKSPTEYSFQELVLLSTEDLPGSFAIIKSCTTLEIPTAPAAGVSVATRVLALLAFVALAHGKEG